MNKPHRQNLQTPSLAPRPGEGNLVDIVVDNFPGPDGTNVTNIGLNISEAPVPDRKYVADACAVSSDRGTVKIMFGQERVGQRVWRSLVLVQMTAEAVGRFLGSLQQTGGVLAAPNPFVTKYGPESLAKEVVEPEGQAIALGANLVAVSINENEACLDFYQASPFSMGAAIKSKKLAVDPVVRIDLRASLFFAMVDGIKGLGIEPQQLVIKGKAS